MRQACLCAVAICLSAAIGSIQGQELFIEESGVRLQEVDEIYVKGLQYLVSQQTPAGVWPDQPYASRPGVVGLAVLSLLAHGDDPNFGPYSGTIERALNFIIEAQDEQTGYIGRSMYNHAFATLALAEAYGAVQDERLGPALEKAVRLILAAQRENPLGGWRYSPDSDDADTTVSGAQMVALFAARNAGIAVPEEAIQKGLDFFRSCQTSEGGFGYTSSTSPNAARTAIACLTFSLANEKDSAAYQRGFQFLQGAPEQRNYHHYYLYYASQAYFHESPAAWREWNKNNIEELKKTQNPDGSWDGNFGPTFATSASLLSLALNYRFLPIYER